MIFYFSATGNTLHAAKKVAEATGDRLVDISDVAQEISVPVDDETIGFVLPTYFYGIPSLLPDLIAKLDVKHPNPFIYLVLTCGGTSGNASGVFEKMLEQRGLHLSATHTVRMVDNYVPMFKIVSPSEIASRLKDADGEIDIIAKKILWKSIDRAEEHRGRLPGVMTTLAYPMYKHGRKTSKFTVSDTCIGCGLCAKNCPAKAIKIVDKKPVWVKDRCVLCLRCLHRCPKESINYGRKTGDNGRYSNPDEE